MRLSVVAAWLKALPVAGFAILTLLSAPQAYGQNWDSLAQPSQNSLGQSYCMLWYGQSRPLMQFTIRDDGAHFIVVSANEFSGASANGEATLRLPSGEIVIANYDAPLAGVLLTSFSQTGFAQILDHFEKPGEFSASVGGQRINFPVSDMRAMIAQLWKCAAVLR